MTTVLAPCCKRVYFKISPGFMLHTTAHCLLTENRAASIRFMAAPSHDFLANSSALPTHLWSLHHLRITDRKISGVYLSTFLKLQMLISSHSLTVTVVDPGETQSIYIWYF